MIIHVVPAADWNGRSGGDYRPETLDGDGFVHCCELDQLTDVIARWFPDQANLIALEIDPDLLAVPLVHEDLYGHGEFPHIYGAINSSAIVAAHPVRLTSAGDAEIGGLGTAQPV